MNDDLQQLKDDVRAIKRAVIGDDEYQQAGLVHRVTSLEKWRENLALRIAFLMGAAGILGWIINKLI
jgi:hypothetical protein